MNSQQSSPTPGRNGGQSQALNQRKHRVASFPNSWPIYADDQLIQSLARRSTYVIQLFIMVYDTTWNNFIDLIQHYHKPDV